MCSEPNEICYTKTAKKVVAAFAHLNLILVCINGKHDLCYSGWKRPFQIRWSAKKFRRLFDWFFSNRKKKIPLNFYYLFIIKYFQKKAFFVIAINFYLIFFFTSIWISVFEPSSTPNSQLHSHLAYNCINHDLFKFNGYTINYALHGFITVQNSYWNKPMNDSITHSVQARTKPVYGFISVVFMYWIEPVNGFITHSLQARIKPMYSFISVLFFVLDWTREQFHYTLTSSTNQAHVQFHFSCIYVLDWTRKRFHYRLTSSMNQTHE